MPRSIPFTFPFPFIAIDIETTDSNADKGSIIQIGSVLVSQTLQIEGSLNLYIKPLDDHDNPLARRVHQITPQKLAKEGKKPEEALTKFEKLCSKAGRRPILASWGNYFDINYLKTYYQRLGRKWPFSYRSVDLKSIALWKMAERGIPMGDVNGHGVEAFLSQLDLDFEGIPHNAIDDIHNTIRILQLLHQNIPSSLNDLASSSVPSYTPPTSPSILSYAEGAVINAPTGRTGSLYRNILRPVNRREDITEEILRGINERMNASIEAAHLLQTDEVDPVSLDDTLGGVRYDASSQITPNIPV